MEKSKHPFLPLTRLDYNQPDPEFDEAFIDTRSRVSVFNAHLPIVTAGSTNNYHDLVCRLGVSPNQSLIQDLVQFFDKDLHWCSNSTMSYTFFVLV